MEIEYKDLPCYDKYISNNEKIKEIENEIKSLIKCDLTDWHIASQLREHSNSLFHYVNKNESLTKLLHLEYNFYNKQTNK